MDHHTEHHEDEQQADEPQKDATGDRPEHPAEGTRPPGNPEADPERVEKGEENIERTGAN